MTRNPRALDNCWECWVPGESNLLAIIQPAIRKVSGEKALPGKHYLDLRHFYDTLQKNIIKRFRADGSIRKYVKRQHVCLHTSTRPQKALIGKHYPRFQVQRKSMRRSTLLYNREFLLYWKALLKAVLFRGISLVAGGVASADVENLLITQKNWWCRLGPAKPPKRSLHTSESQITKFI